MDCVQILVLVFVGPYAQTCFEFLKKQIDFLRIFFVFVNMGPHGSKISKRYSYIKSLLNIFKLFLNFLLSGPHKSFFFFFFFFNFFFVFFYLTPGGRPPPLKKLFFLNIFLLTTKKKKKKKKNFVFPVFEGLTSRETETVCFAPSLKRCSGTSRSKEYCATMPQQSSPIIGTYFNTALIR